MIFLDNASTSRVFDEVVDVAKLYLSDNYFNPSATYLPAIKIKKDFDFDILGKDVIIVEDIIDTGITLSNLDVVLKERNPNSITYVCMLDKPSRRKVDFDADIVGIVIDNLFVIGFGLDYNEQFRNLKDVCVYEGE